MALRRVEKEYGGKVGFGQENTGILELKTVLELDSVRSLIRFWLLLWLMVI